MNRCARCVHYWSAMKANDVKPLTVSAWPCQKGILCMHQYKMCTIENQTVTPGPRFSGYDNAQLAWLDRHIQIISLYSIDAIVV